MKTGKILLVGIGPGAHEHMTFRAKQAIAEADVVIGYSTYIKLVTDLLEGKEVIRKGMTEELDRSIEAYEHAKQGKIVALISSGDIGVYGMAGPTYELLLESGWTPDDPIQVEVVPGSTALLSCASLVGAPLTHDFCSISLSDLLTPWPVIARRLESAARGDFVVALYNPKSGRRTQHIVEAQNILLRHRSPDTPVAIVKSGYRSLQNIQLVTLAEMAECDIGMLTTVLVGNSSTFVRAGLMVTPRGYANKYDALSGETLAGEQAGRSLSMGLDGWKACVRGYLRETPKATLQEAASYFDRPLAEILDAVTKATTDDAAGVFSAQAVNIEQFDDLLSALSNWGSLRVVVRSEGGAVAELLINGADLQLNKGWLSIVNEHFHLHIDWRNARQAWFVSRGDAAHGLQIVNAHGDNLLNLWLVAQSGSFDADALTRYQHDKGQLTHSSHPKQATP
ncbi:MAG: precorrin-3B C(17)-methyltransferase [Methylococcaceae bacterium]|nr:precorrin-3B C(17)-methyltransferase [Methylococcaceae bacterium]MDZ4097308.1 precorrin-3B C(17)-methyltransferase [Methylophilaceae bacterium]MDZ4156270.1 precorrin-3B C(17)-methyltransferase [Methylococcales bacterium]MDP2393418.1 precorrin-3B C(17)-methyltransferase [Methylococcaceae bacterium]MDP3019875.1 precorrin-3B C(17)-methyltransferase [Methylococcaceae bacterium]